MCGTAVVTVKIKFNSSSNGRDFSVFDCSAAIVIIILPVAENSGLDIRAVISKGLLNVRQL